MAEFTQRLGFDLADPLSRDLELPSDLFQRAGTPVFQSEAEFDHLLFSGSEGVENVAELLA